jgi:hypothetical protein
MYQPGEAFVRARRLTAAFIVQRRKLSLESRARHWAACDGCPGRLNVRPFIPDELFGRSVASTQPSREVGSGGQVRVKGFPE